MSDERDEATHQPPTIYDISKVANVSPSTVSRALSTPGRLNRATEARIRIVADSLGYRPNRSALSLSTGKTRCLGLIAPNVSNPFFAEFLRAFQHAADLLGYLVIFVDVNEDADIEAEAIRRLRVQTDGIALCAPRSTTDALTKLINPSTTVVFNREIEGAHCIMLDSSSALREAIEDLASAGHKSFVYVPDAPHAIGDRVRRQACRRIAAARSMTMILDETHTNDRDGARHAVELAIASRAGAILAHSDMVGMWILHECHIRGIEVPDSMSVVGHDNIEYVAAATPPMTTVDAKIALVASRMATMLIASLDGSDQADPGGVEVVEAAYVARNTVGPSAAASRKPAKASVRTS